MNLWFSGILSLMFVAGCATPKTASMEFNVTIPVKTIEQEQITRQVEAVATMGVFPDQPEKWSELETRKLDRIDDIYKRLPKDYQEKYGKFLPYAKLLAALLLGVYGDEVPAIAGFAALLGAEGIDGKTNEKEKIVIYRVRVQGMKSEDVQKVLDEVKQIMKGARFEKDASTL